MLTEALDAGARALAENDVDTAIARFEAALLIAPDHQDAERGLVQARNRGAIIEYMDRGRKAEAANDLEAARERLAHHPRLVAAEAAAGRRVDDRDDPFGTRFRRGRILRLLGCVQPGSRMRGVAGMCGNRTHLGR